MDEVKSIKFERTGGFAGMRVAAEFTLDDLSDDQVRRVRKLLDEVDFDELPEQLSGKNLVADGFSYSITVKGDEGQHTVSIGENGAPEKLQPLLDLLSQIARQQMRKKND